MRNFDRVKDKIEILLDPRQVVVLAVGMTVVAGALFAGGYVVGREQGRRPVGSTPNIGSIDPDTEVGATVKQFASPPIALGEVEFLFPSALGARPARKRPPVAPLGRPVMNLPAAVVPVRMPAGRAGQPESSSKAAPAQAAPRTADRRGASNGVGVPKIASSPPTKKLNRRSGEQTPSKAAVDSRIVAAQPSASAATKGTQGQAPIGLPGGESTATDPQVDKAPAAVPEAEPAERTAAPAPRISSRQGTYDRPAEAVVERDSSGRDGRPAAPAPGAAESISVSPVAADRPSSINRAQPAEPSMVAQPARVGADPERLEGGGATGAAASSPRVPASPTAVTMARPPSSSSASASSKAVATGTEATKPKPVRKPARAKPRTQYTLQVKAMREKGEADEFVATLKAAGFRPHVVLADIPGKGRFYRVRLGRFASMEEARHFQRRFKTLSGQPDAGFITDL